MPHIVIAAILYKYVLKKMNWRIFNAAFRVYMAISIGIIQCGVDDQKDNGKLLTI